MSTQAVQVAAHINAPLATVWQALTNLEVLGRAFFGSKVETTWKVGEPILFFCEWEGMQFQDKGELTGFSAEKQLRFTHWSPLSGLEDRSENYHLVTFDLEPSGVTTNIRLTQDTRTETPLDDETRRELVRNWSAVLVRLKKAAE